MLFQVCKPFDKFRRIIWAVMAVAMVACFTLLSGFFHLETGTAESTLILLTLVIMTPTVFFAVQRVFDLGDKVYLWIRTRWAARKSKKS